ncbi:MAG: beta-ketoacyl-[acyl-carrier-protein] synthase II [Spirochaetaceae bacterium]|nr:MAG: beta-ketoacyl-[acyl-carrier-protein] synthase II [Spirochaetaceae bacterium]
MTATDGRIFVTGIGVFCAVGHDRRQFWDALCSGMSGAAAITAFDAAGQKCRVAAEVKAFEPEQYLSAKRIRRMARFSQLASCAALQAVADAGLDLQSEDSSRVGTVIGTAAGDYRNLEAQYRTLVDKGPGFGNPLAVPRIIPNMSSANVGIDLAIHGPNLGMVTACSSGAHAIAIAAALMRSGGVDVMLAGGAESTITPLVVDAYACMGVLTSRNDDPAAASRPFDADRDGFVIGEGAAVLVLETEAHARARGAEPLAVCAGAGMTADAYSIAIPEPDGAWAAAAIRGALNEARLDAGDVDYVNAHGTSTVANDRIETLAIKSALGPHAYKAAISSNKSMIGHTLGAAGAVEAAATVLTIRNGVIPPTINYHTPDPECDLDIVPNQARQRTVNAAISNSFGFGGQNCVLAFTRVE